MDLSPTRHLELRDSTRIRRLSGFGRVTYGDSYVYEPESTEGVEALFALAQSQGMQIVVRGAGRSYGDAAVLPEAVAISLARMNRILAWDGDTHTVNTQAGVTMAELCSFALGKGHWPPAVGGIGAPTLGGAVAMNIHGKNHRMVGAMAEHIEEIEIVSPKLGCQVLKPGDPAFPAIVGGLGLMGIVTRIKLRLLPVPSTSMDVFNRPFRIWDDHFRAFASLEPADAFVSWIDGFNHKGRGIFERGRYARDPDSTEEPPSAGIASRHAWRVLKAISNPLGMHVASSLRYGQAYLKTRRSRQHLAKFNHPLDSLVEWERAYLPGGLIQFQGFVPASSAADAIPQLSELARAAGLPSYLSVLKRHRPSNSVLNPYGDSYSLAMDFKLTNANHQGLVKLFHDMTRLVLDSRGSFYLAKDLLLTADEFRASVGLAALDEHSRWRNTFDPSRVLASTQSVRLGL